MLPIKESVRAEIIDALNKIEKDFNVKILYACESGSRAWGFPSANSDYDVRFLYIHPVNWYLAVNLEEKRDVIELPIHDDLDVSGWDLRKALKLFRKSNPPLLEWLGSPIIYWEKFSVAQQMRELAPVAYSPISCMYHYFSMAKGNYRDYLKGETVKTKKYFYVLRPLLGVKWLEQDLGVVPTEFQKLIEATVPDGDLKNEIYQLIKRKRAGDELAEGPVIPVVSEFIRSEVERLEAAEFEKRVQKAPVDQLNSLFQNALTEVFP